MCVYNICIIKSIHLMFIIVLCKHYFVLFTIYKDWNCDPIRQTLLNRCSVCPSKTQWSVLAIANYGASIKYS